MKFEIDLKQVAHFIGVRESVLKFAVAMEQKLKQNDKKSGWKNCEDGYLTKRLGDEVGELRRAIKKHNGTSETRVKLRKEAADVGNFAMMIFDNYETL